ncbi:MAG: hypothetical protein GX889_07365 [Clostridiales bacterium]|mgnify:CR=1 FL=1|nr:hypothetical protein [Clostridiales bacterium]
MIKVGEKIYVNDSIGNVIILDVQKEYLILFRENCTFIKANDYFIKNGRLVWSYGDYYNSFIELALDIAEVEAGPQK